MTRVKYLSDVNVLIALTDESHIHHNIVKEWYDASGYRDFGVCAFTEAGFLRVTTNARAGSHTIAQATEILSVVTKLPGYRFWPLSAGWNTLVAPFRERIFGHQQVTGAYLLGLAVKENGVLVTLDKGLKFLAGPDNSHNVLVIE